MASNAFPTRWQSSRILALLKAAAFCFSPALLMAAGLFNGAAAQSASPLPLGASARIMPRLPPYEWRYGRLTALTADSIALSDGRQTLVYSTNAASRLQVRLRPSRSIAKPAILGGLAGIAAGALFVPFVRGIACAQSLCEPMTFGRASLAVGAIALMTAGSAVAVTVAWNASRPWDDLLSHEGELWHARTPGELSIRVQLAY